MLLLIMMSSLGLGDVNPSLRALGWQRALRTLGRLVRFGVWRVGHCLMLVGTTVDLQMYDTCNNNNKKEKKKKKNKKKLASVAE